MAKMREALHAVARKNRSISQVIKIHRTRDINNVNRYLAFDISV